MQCGFARVAIYEYSKQPHCKAITSTSVDKEARVKNFQAHFMTAPQFVNSDSYYRQQGTNQSRFDKHCKVIVEIFKKRWNPHETKKSYLEHFSINNWRSLSQRQKEKHTITTCKGCTEKHLEQQLCFPIKDQPTLKTELSKIKLTPHLSKKQTTRKVLAELDNVYQEKFDCSFTESIPKDCPRAGLEKKRTGQEKKKEKRQILRQCKTHMEAQFTSQDADTVLEEGLSLRKYQQLRLAQSFETPQQKQTRAQKGNPKKKSHSPNFANVTWDKNGLLAESRTLEGHRVNWMALGRKYGIPGKNAGQVVKEYLQSQGIDTSSIDGRVSNTRVRARKLRMPGGEISVPCHSTISTVKDEWLKKIEQGVYSIGEQCSPKQLTMVKAENSRVITKEVTVSSRKIPLTEVREKLLRKHEKWMRLMTNEQIDAMSREEAVLFLKQIHQPTCDLTCTEEVHELVKQCQRARTLGVWHDHDTLFGHGYIMVTIQVFYDPAVFLTDDEAKESIPGRDIQSVVELPEVHMLAICGSSHAEQAALIPDRVSCLSDLDKALTSSNGCSVNDTLKFFSGDHPAQSFERGCQQGGTFICGSCGVRADMVSDIAHSL